MTPLLIALLGVLLLPLFVASWRASLLGLACQGFLMAWIFYRLTPGPRLIALLPESPSACITFLDLALVRGLVAPMALYGLLRSRNLPARHDVIPPNLLSWAAALSMVVASFSFSQALVVETGHEQTLVAVACAGVLLGFLVLATQSNPLSQMVGVLRIENAIALFELGGKPHHTALGLQFLQSVLYLITVGLFRWYLAMLTKAPSVTLPEDAEDNAL